MTELASSNFNVASSHDNAGASTQATLHEEGVTCLRGVLAGAELDLLARAFAWSVANPSDKAHVFPPTPGNPGRFFADINNAGLLSGDSPYPQLIAGTGIGDALAELWGSEKIWFLYEQVLSKEGAAARRTPWHQDSSYLPIAGEMIAIVWLSLDSLERPYSLECVAGSHHGPLYDGSAFDAADDTAPIYGDGTMPRLPPIEEQRDRWPIRGWAVEPGDAIVFHPATLHGGAPTAAGMRRRTVSLRFFGDDAIYRPLPSNGVRGIGIEGQTIWDKLAVTLESGDPLCRGEFLQVRPGGAP